MNDLRIVAVNPDSERIRWGRVYGAKPKNPEKCYFHGWTNTDELDPHGIIEDKDGFIMLVPYDDFLFEGEKEDW